MILVSFFSEGNVLSDERKKCYIFGFQSSVYIPREQSKDPIKMLWV